MLRFVLRKMVNKKWMMLALLLGNILLIGITCANVMYGRAALQRTLTQNLSGYLTQENKHPGLIAVKADGLAARNAATMEAVQMVHDMPQRFGIPAVGQVDSYWAGPAQVVPEVKRENGMAKMAALMMMSDLRDHIRLTAGRMYSDDADTDGIVDVIVSESGMMEMNLLMGEVFTFPTIKGLDGEPLRVRVCGVFDTASVQDSYWVRSPSEFRLQCFVSEEMFSKLFFDDTSAAQANSGVGISAQCYVMLDYTEMNVERAVQLLGISRDYEMHFYNIAGQSYNAAFDDILEQFDVIEKKVSVTLWVLQIPIFMLLAVFMFMVSRQMLEMERDEIAVLKSRGVSRMQLIAIYLTQSIITAAAGYAAGVPLSILLVQVLGCANAFLEFVLRSPLTVQVDARALISGGIAAVFSAAVMTMPVVRFADVSIVERKQRKHRKSTAPLWQKLFMDVVLLLVGCYGLYSYHSQSELIAQRVLDGAALDPLLFISASVFMIGAGLFVLRILPLITKAVFTLFKRLWSPAVYAAFLQVIRTRSSQSFIMVFLTLTIAMGVFNAQAARTINANEEENIRYKIGADIVVKERWTDNSESMELDPTILPEYTEPDFERYLSLEGAESVTQVLHVKNASMAVSGGTVRNLQVMGIHTKQFGETAWMKEGLLTHHFYEYLNAMSVNPRAVLLSRSLQSDYGYELGDVIYFENASGASARGIVYGFVDYWPGYEPYSYARTAGGLHQEVKNHLIVANIAQLQADWGIMPYEVWIKAKGSTRFVYEFAAQEGIYFSSFEDAAAQITALKNDPVFQGTNGALTVGFIAALLLCSAGFLIYWILSIKGRALQFGIYRAMGMSMREILSMLLCEQIFISGFSAAAGAAVGALTAKLYMPLIRMAYASYDNALPLAIVSEAGDMIKLAAVVGAVILLCMVILLALISHMKIAQALKLGED